MNPKLPKPIRDRLINSNQFIVSIDEYEYYKSMKFCDIDFTPYGFTVKDNNYLWIFIKHINYGCEEEFIRMKDSIWIEDRKVDDMSSINLEDIGKLYTKTEGLRSLIADIMSLNLNKPYLITNSFLDSEHIKVLSSLRLISKRTDYFNPSLGISKTYWFSTRLKKLRSELIELSMDFYKPRIFNSKYDKYMLLIEKYLKHAFNNNLPTGKFHIRFSEEYNCYTGRYWTPLCKLDSDDRKSLGRIEYDVKCSINNLIYYNNHGKLKDINDNNLYDLYTELSDKLKVDRDSIKKNYQYTAFEKVTGDSINYNKYRNEVINQIGINKMKTEIFIQESIIYFLASIVFRFKYNLSVDTVYDNFVFDSNSNITKDVWISVIKECIENWDNDSFLNYINGLIPTIDKLELRWLSNIDVIDLSEYKILSDYMEFKSKLLPIYLGDHYDFILKLNENGIRYVIKNLNKGVEFNIIILHINRMKNPSKYYKDKFSYEETKNLLKSEINKFINSNY